MLYNQNPTLKHFPPYFNVLSNTFEKLSKHLAFSNPHLDMKS